MQNNNSKFKVLFLTLLFFVWPLVSYGAVIINEVMYDAPSPGADDGREWVEVLNNGSEPIDLAGWKFFEEGTNHTLTPISGSVIAPNGFAVIVADPAKFAADWPGPSFTIFDSSFSLKNTGESLSLKNNSGEVVDTVTYDPNLGAGGDGASLQLVGGSWLAASPTPGEINGSVPVTPSSPEPTITPPTTTPNPPANNGLLSAHESQAPLTEVASAEPFKVGAGRPRLASVHSPITFRAASSGTVPSDVHYQWSFGDGGSAMGEQATHIYQFPGEYNIVLNAVSSDGETAVSRTTVSVIQPIVSLGSVSPDRVEVTNRSAREINLGGWRIIQGATAFTFPADTIVATGKSTIVPALYLEFSPASNLPVTLVFPDTTAAFTTSPTPNKETLEVMAQALRQLSLKLTAIKNSRQPVVQNVKPVAIDISTTLDTQSPPSASVASIPVPKPPGFFTRVRSWFGQ